MSNRCFHLALTAILALANHRMRQVKKALPSSEQPAATAAPPEKTVDATNEQVPSPAK